MSLRLWLSTLLLLGLGACLAQAQQPKVHHLHRSDMPPGVIGQQQLMRGPQMAGYVQPVAIYAPEGAEISVWVGGQFDEPQRAPRMIGMQIGYVYQLKVTSIPLHEGAELFPTIELVNRLYPPQGAKLRFPVPVELTREELNFALDGQYVTRVVFLEDPDQALPARDDPLHQRYIDVGSQQDPLLVADRLGRPMAMLRMGSRVPDNDDVTGLPNVVSGPVELYPPEACRGLEGPGSRAEGRGKEGSGSASGFDINKAIERHDHDFRRLPGDEIESSDLSRKP
jgi:hypothetical protein